MKEISINALKNIKEFQNSTEDTYKKEIIEKEYNYFDQPYSLFILNF